jgi:hypothetical protein
MRTVMALALAVGALSAAAHLGLNNDSASCTAFQVRIGQCAFDSDSGHLVVDGTVVAPPSSQPQPGGGPSREAGPPTPAAATPNYSDPCPTWDDPTACARYYDTLPVVTPAEPAESVNEEPAPAITMADIARFAPTAGELVVEPDGWGVVGTPTNFYATAESHTMDGELFDTAIQVRWTPASYRFDYGDGTVQESDASGSAWRGTEESWTETATSHTYSSTDDVTASVTVIFTAEVDAGGGWFAVPGTLPVEAPTVAVKVFAVDTVLTDGDCRASPSAAGCG